MNLQELLTLDELFAQAVDPRRSFEASDPSHLIDSFLRCHAPFVLTDFCSLLPDGRLRETARAHFVKEVLYALTLFLFLAAEVNEADHLSGKTSDEFQMPTLAEVKRETISILRRILSNVHSVFVLRCETLADSCSVYCQSHPLYRRIKLLVSRRRSNAGLSTSDITTQMTKYLLITEQALGQIFEINADRAPLRYSLISALEQLTQRVGPLTLQEQNKYFSFFGVSIDAKGRAIVDTALVARLIGRLPSSPSPALPPPRQHFTLVLDLDETLIHFPDERLTALEAKIAAGVAPADLRPHLEFGVRPFCREFLAKLKPLYELVVFTAASQAYADLVLDALDWERTIEHRLYRQHTTEKNGKTLKDLSLLGRDLRRVIIVDNTPENFSLQPGNGLHVPTWTGDPMDRCLSWLLPLLANIARSEPLDVREVLEGLRLALQQ